jgi:hypothetical protein
MCSYVALTSLSLCHTTIKVLQVKMEIKEHRSWMLEHLPELDLHITLS